MSTELILLIVGVLLLILAFLGLSKAKFQIPLGVLGILLIIY